MPRRGEIAPGFRECPECLSEIPGKATRCRFCGSRGLETHDPLDDHLAEPDVIGYTTPGTTIAPMQL